MYARVDVRFSLPFDKLPYARCVNLKKKKKRKILMNAKYRYNESKMLN